MKLGYPFKKAVGSSYSYKEMLELLQKESTGHYLFGQMNFWHGGVHFTDTANAELKDRPVRCIANGTIVAYRINKSYVVSSFDNDKEKICQRYQYSTSFCLIRHEYESPEAPQKMCLQNAAAQSPTDWHNRTIELKDERNVRNTAAENDAAATFRVTLPAGTRLKITHTGGTDNKFATAKIVSFANTLDRSKSFTDAKNTSANKTLNIGDEVYFSAFSDSNGTVATSSSKALFTDVSHTIMDWSETKAITTKAAYQGYNTVPNPTQVITVPQNIQLQVVQISTVAMGGKIHAQVRASQALNATTTGDTPQTSTIAAGTTFWIPITDEFGNIETVQDNNKTVPAVEAKRNTNKLTFYSLYMHLLPWDEYPYNKDSAASSKEYLQTTIGGKQHGSGGGVDERSSAAAPADNSNVTQAAVAKGTIYEITERTTADGFEFAKGYRCDADGKRTSETAVWFKTGGKNKPGSYMQAYQTPAQAQANTTTYGQIPVYWYENASITAKAIGELEVYTLMADSQGNLGLGVKGTLQTNATFTYNTPADFEEKTVSINNAPQVLKLIKCTLASGTIQNNSNAQNATFYLIRNEATLKMLREKVEPAADRLNSIVSSSMEVDAGDVLGLMGKYDTLASPEGGVNSKHQLHFEIFANDTQRLEPFLNNQAKVTTGIRYLVLKKGAALRIGTTPDNLLAQNAQNLPALPAPYFSGTTPTLLHQWILPLSQTPKTADTNKAEWYRIPIQGLAQNTYGWIEVTNNNAEAVNQYDLKKLGFTVIEESDSNTLGFAGDGFVDPGNDSTPQQTNLFKDLFNRVDELDKKDGILTPQEVTLAYRNEILGEVLRKVVAYHPSEWHGQPEDAKWSRLATDVLKGEENRLVLQHEQERIRKGVFWHGVAELTSTLMVHHFHPVTFINAVIDFLYPTWDSTTNTRIELLHPAIRDDVYRFINHVEYELGMRLRVGQGLRTIAEQNNLYAQGRTAPGQIVTNARGGSSYHNYGLAIDILEIKNGQAIWHAGTSTEMKNIAAIGKSYDFSWGGDWTSFKDYPHFERSYGYSVSQLLNKVNNNETTDGYVNL